jgi:ophiobolin F synthase
MVEFSLGIMITDEEYQMMAEPIAHVERCMLLTNDYWSWPREREQAKIQEAGKVFNIVWFLMKTEGSTEQEAKAKVRNMVHEEELKWVAAKNRFYSQHPNLRLDLIKFLENLHTALAGNDYWSSQCYRHNDWGHTPELPSEDVELRQLADLGRVLTNDNMPSKDMVLEPDEDLCSTKDLAHNLSVEKASSESSHGSVYSPNRPSSVYSDKLATKNSTPTTASLSSPTTKHFQASGIRHACTSMTLDFSVIEEPITYIKCMPSKNLRTQLIDCFNLFLQVPESAMATIKQVIDNLHQSSLILDDIEDNSQQRRGFPATHIVYGTSQAVNSATYLYVQAVEAVHKTTRNNPEMMDAFLEHLKQLFKGQSWDIYWTYHRQCPTEEEYLQMVDQKTGAMIQLLVDLMNQQRTQQLRTRGADKQALLRFVQLFGRYFQVRDDYVNLTSIDYAKQKGWAEDLDEQKFSYPIVHLYQRYPSARDKFEGVFKSMKHGSIPQAAAETSKKYLLSILEETGSLQATQMLLVKMFDDIVDEIGVLEKHFGVENMLLRLLVVTLRI